MAQHDGAARGSVEPFRGSSAAPDGAMAPNATVPTRMAKTATTPARLRIHDSCAIADGPSPAPTHTVPRRVPPDRFGHGRVTGANEGRRRSVAPRRPIGTEGA